MAEPVFIKRKVLFGDCDPEGIVYTPRFSHFALEATHEALGQWLGGACIKRLKDLGVLPPVRAFSQEFLHPVTWDDELYLKVSVGAVGVHSFCLKVEGNILPQTEAFSADITYVCVSEETKRPTNVPDELRNALT